MCVFSLFFVLYKKQAFWFKCHLSPLFLYPTLLVLKQEKLRLLFLSFFFTLIEWGS